jgi:osmoprotectant transport system substrate-binding protein
MPMRSAPRSRWSRLAAAALALVSLAALAGCGRADALSGKPTVVIGAKEFTEEWVIGQLYKQALAKAGFNVELKNNIGSTTIIDTALTSGQIDLYPEYTGVVLQVLAEDQHIPYTASATFDQAKAYEEKRGLTLLSPTPFEDKDAVGVLTSTARKYHLKSVGDLAKLGGVAYGEYPDNMSGSLSYAAVAKAYGLKGLTVKELNIGLQYTALDAHQIQAADVFTTDPQLARGGRYTLLDDPKDVFGFQNVAPVVRRSVLKQQGPAFGRTLDRVDALLTDRAMQAMNYAVAVDRLDPAEVADKFLRANGLK